MELLQIREDRGYPTEYFLSRIRGRRSRLIADWKPLIYEPSPLDHLSSEKYRGGALVKSPENIWRRLLMEFAWGYAQMNGTLREIFRPFFLYSELRTLFICLRRVKDGKAGQMDDLLSVSLLSDEIKTVLKTSEDIASAVAEIETLFLSLSQEFRGLAGLLDTEGLRGVEQRLANTYLIHIINTRPHPLMKTFFVRIIDSRNILGLYKALRLNVKAKPVFIPGGNITEERFGEILAREDVFKVNALIREATGIKIDVPDATRVETALYRGMTRFLRKEGRDPLGVGLILDYLWRCSLEAMNLSVLVHAGELEREAVSVELVY